MLPDGNGVEVLTWVRETLGWEVPVIVVTAREDEQSVCCALLVGADDYIVKPPKPMELLARLQAVARRVSPGGQPVLRSGSFEIDVARQKLSVDGVPVPLTQKEFDLSVYLFDGYCQLVAVVAAPPSVAQ
jgi:DNA-binding response OmpR family regulator